MGRLSLFLKKHRWLKSTRDHTEQQKLDATELPPFLPVPRRSLLTPIPWETPTGRFFELPYHIRTIILSIAFGGSNLHIDLERKENSWEWKGAVCDQASCPLLPPFSRFDTHVSRRSTALDGCLSVADRHSGRFREEKYNIGIMGFLLSCRQAYGEGIELLFSANCFTIYSEPLLLQLPRLLPLNRLEAIVSLEVVVANYRRHATKLDHLELELILENIASHLFRLRRFSLCLLFVPYRSGYGANPSKIAHTDGATVPGMCVIDRFHRSMRLHIMQVELPTWIYDYHDHSGALQHPREKPIESPYQRALWRSLDEDQPVVQSRSTERYPYAPLRMPADGDASIESKESEGYWIFERQPRTSTLESHVRDAQF